MANTTRIETSSDGAWQGDNPLNFAFPLLIVQTILVLFITHFLAFLLKPLRQPKVIAEILVLNDEMFAILVLMALFTTFMTTPTVMAIYKSSSSDITNSKRQQRSVIKTPKGSKIKEGHDNHDDHFRILACIHGPGSVPSLVNLIDSLRTKSPLKLYVMHLVELTDRSSSIMMVQRARKNGVPVVNRFRGGRRGGGRTLHDQVSAAFEAYSRALGGQLVTVRHTTGISALSSMHEDILHVAETKRVSMILLPFHKQYCWGENHDGVEDQPPTDLGNGWGEVNNRVLKSAPCSVAVFIDRGFGVVATEPAADSSGSSAMSNARLRKVCAVFVGGADDRKALELGGRMAQHEEDFKVTVVRLLIQNPAQHTINEIMDQQRYCCSISAINDKMEKELDEAAIAEVKSRCMINATLEMEWIEKEIPVESNIAESVLRSICQLGKVYELVIVGKESRFPINSTNIMVSRFHKEQAEYLGHIGDALASPQAAIRSSVLVVQRHDQLSELSSTTALLLPNNMVGAAKDEMIMIRNIEESVV